MRSAPTDSSVKSTVRAIDLLELLATSEQGLSLAELSAFLGAPKSSTLMILRTLVQRAYVERDRHHNYIINPLLQNNLLGWVGGEKALLVRRALPIMRRVVEEVRETALLHTLNEARKLRIVAQVVSPRDIRCEFSLSRLPPPLLMKTAGGKVQLAFLPQADIDAVLNEECKTQADRRAALEELEQVRQAGIGMLVDTWVAGASAVSAPIFDASGTRPIGAFTIAAVTARFMADQDLIVFACKNAAYEIHKATIGPGD